MDDDFVDPTPIGGEITRQAGGFYRSVTGTPYVSDPTGALTKPKNKKDVPHVKRLAYGRPSSFGKQIEDTYNLQKWSERTVALGIGAAQELLESCAALVGRDRDSVEWRSDADLIVVRAKDAARSMLAADRGTHGHEITQEDDEERDWILLAERGEILGLDRDVQASLVQAWRDMLDREGLEILAVEASVVHDGWRKAGTLDRIARCTRPLRFSMHGGDIVEIPAGTVLVLDIKSGKRRLAPNGTVMYWQSYAVQFATYAGAVPYDTETDTRGVWPWPIDQKHGVIAHLDVLGALEGKPSCELVYVDVAAGRHAAELCLAANAWEKRADVFSIAQLEPVTVPVDRRGQLQERCRVIAELNAEAARVMAATWPDGVGSLADKLLSFAQIEAIEAHVEGFEATVSAPFAEPVPNPQPVVNSQPEPVVETPLLPDTLAVEGDDLHDNDPIFTAMKARYTFLDQPAHEWMAQVVEESITAGRSIHMASHRTMRRARIVSGLTILAVAGYDEMTRDLVRLATGCDAVLDARIPLGAAVSIMTATQAATFAGLAEAFVTDPSRFGMKEGHLELQPAA